MNHFDPEDVITVGGVSTEGAISAQKELVKKSPGDDGFEVALRNFVNFHNENDPQATEQELEAFSTEERKCWTFS